jgi:sugar phosphate isomerase/epimerase
MIRLAAFADEIAPDLETQIAVLESEGLHYLELRGVWNTNVLDLTDDQVTVIARTLTAHGIGVSAIGSPLGKVPIDSPFDQQLHHLERALMLARFFHAPFVRIFSFYPPAAGAAADPATYRALVLAHLREMTARARAADVALLHENEKAIYGDTIARCVDLLTSIADPYLGAVLDPANFIQCGERPYPDAYQALHPWLRYVHVKDARADGGVVVAGAGAAAWPALLSRLRADGYDGFFSLEPHLAAAGRFAGFSGPDLFRQAAHAFQRLLQEAGWAYA